MINSVNLRKNISVLKAIGMIAVVVGHAAGHINVGIFTYFFSIPVFLFVAGYFFQDDDLNSPISFFKKKLKRLFLPFVVYGIVMVLLHNVLIDINWLSFNFRDKIPYPYYDIQTTGIKILQVLTFFQWKEPILAPLWFLYGLFSGLTVFYVVSLILSKMNWLKDERVRLIMMISLTILAIIADQLLPRFNLITRPVLIAGIIYTGKFYRQFEHKIKLYWPLAVFFLVILMVLAAQNYHINVGAMYLNHPFAFLPIVFAGIYAMLTFANLISQQKGIVINFLNLIGQNTLSIMALHYFVFKLITYLQIHLYDLPDNYLSYYPVIPMLEKQWWIIHSIAGIVISLIISLVYEKLKCLFLLIIEPVLNFCCLKH